MNRLFILTAAAAMIAGATGCECTRGSCRTQCNPCQPACGPYGGTAPPYMSGPTDPYLSAPPGAIQVTPSPETYTPAPVAR